MPVDGFVPYKKKDVQKYNKLRWWLGITWGDMFDKATDVTRKRSAVDDTSRFTYAQLREKVDKAAIGFMNLGIKQKDFVLVQIPTGTNSWLHTSPSKRSAL